MRTYNNKIGDRIIRVILCNGNRIGRRELQRKTGFAPDTVGKWLTQLRKVGAIRSPPGKLICLTEWVIRHIKSERRFSLEIDNRRKQRRLLRDPRRKIVRGRAAADRKNELEYNKQKVIFHILLRAVRPEGVTRYYRRDTEFTKYAFDYLTLSEPPILQVSSHSSETSEETLVILDPVLRDFIIRISQLLDHLLNRMQLKWRYGKRKTPTKEEAEWFEYFYLKEISNRKLTDLYYLRNQIDKDNSNYKSEIENYDRQIRRKWNDIKSNYSCLFTKNNIYIYCEVCDLMTKVVYPQFLQVSTQL